MALVPWPEDAALQHQAASLLSFAVFGNNDSENRAKSVRLGPVAAALIDRFAPLAPIPVQDECVFRIVGWLAEKGLNTTFTAGSVTVRKSRGRDELSALKYSGSAALLNPWKRRRAGKVTASPVPAIRPAPRNRPNYFFGSVPGDVVTEREFLDIGREFFSDYVVLTGGGTFIMNFGLTIPQVEVIRAPNGRNIRHQFGDDPVQLTISDSQYFVFSSNAARQVTTGTWLLQA